MVDMNTRVGAKAAPTGIRPPLAAPAPQPKPNAQARPIRDMASVARGPLPTPAERAQTSLKDQLGKLNASINAKIKEGMAAPPEQQAIALIEVGELKAMRGNMYKFQAVVSALAGNPKATAQDWAKMGDRVDSLRTAAPFTAPMVVQEAESIARLAGGGKRCNSQEEAHAGLSWNEAEWNERIQAKAKDVGAATPEHQTGLMMELQEMQGVRANTQALAKQAAILDKKPGVTPADWAKFNERAKEALAASPDRQPVGLAAVEAVVRNAAGGKQNTISEQMFHELGGLTGEWTARIHGRLREAYAATPENQPALQAEAQEMQHARDMVGQVKAVGEAFTANPKASEADWKRFQAKAMEVVSSSPEKQPALMAELGEITREAGGAPIVPARQQAMLQAGLMQGEWTTKISNKLRESLATVPERQPALLAEAQELAYNRESAEKVTAALERIAKHPNIKPEDWAKVKDLTQAVLEADPENQPTKLLGLEKFEWDLSMR